MKRTYPKDKNKNSRRNKNKIIRINPRLLIVLLLIAIIVFSLCTNLFNSKTEASTKEVYDIILFWGQSNMVGSANGGSEKRQGTTEEEMRVFAEKTGIDYDEIVTKIQARHNVDINVPQGVAYEYLCDPDNYVKDQPQYTGTSWATMSNKTGNHGLVWSDSHLKPVGYDYVYGETVRAELDGTIYKLVGDTLDQPDPAHPTYHTHTSACVNMVPEFCNTYYKLTGRKVIAVVCAFGGKGIQDFALTNASGQVNGTYVVMSRKMWQAKSYVENTAGMKVGRQMFVSMQGEQTSGINTAEDYVNWYRRVVDDLKADHCVTNGAICETGGMIWDGPRALYTGYQGALASSCISLEVVNRIHTAQETLWRNYSDTVLGSSFGYNSFVPLTEEEYARCTTSICYIPGTSTKWSYDQAIAHASLRMDYDYGYKPQTNNKTSQLVRNTSYDQNYIVYNGIHYTAASLCQIGKEAATALAGTFNEGQVTLSLSSGTVTYGGQKTFSIASNRSGGTIYVASEDPSIASIDTSVLANSAQASLVNTQASLELSGTTVKINANKTGSTKIWVTSAANGDYTWASTCYDITVVRKQVTVPTLSGTSKTYNGSTQSVTVNGYDSNTMRQGGNASGSNVGSYTVTWNLRDTINYEWNDGSISQKSASWTIGKVTPTVTLNPSNGGVNVGATTTFTANITSGSGSVSVTSSNESVATARYSNGTVTVTGVSAGNATITVTSDSNANYNSKSATYSVTVTNAEKPVPTITLNDTYNTNGVIDRNEYVELVASKPDGTGNWTYSSSNPDIIVTLTSTNTFKINNSSFSKTGAATITIGCEEGSTYAAGSTTYKVIILHAEGESEVYDGEGYGISVTCNGASITYSTDGTNYSSNNPTFSDAGEYTVYYKISKSGYNDVTGSKTVIISKRTLAVAAWPRSKTYGEENPSLTYKYSGNVSGQTPGFTGNLTTTAMQNSGVGQYDITNSNLSITDNGTFKASNYNMTFTGSKLTVRAKEIGDMNLIIDPLSCTYDGNEKTPTVTLKDGNTTLTKDTDYTVSYSNNTNVGTATVTVSGKGNYTGTKTGTFTIINSNLENAEVTLSETSTTYDGSAKTPAITVKLGGTTLTKDTDYTVSYSNNTNAGTATVTVTGTGIYVGSKSITFTIAKRELKVIADAQNKTYGESNPNLTYTYSGNVSNQTPKFNGGLKTAATQSSPAGQYDITNNDLSISDNGTFKASNYNMTFTGAKLTINAKGISNFTLTIEPTSTTYDGSAKTPAITLKDGNTTLVKDTDYTLEITNNVNAGTANVKVTGKGNYSGTKNGTFTINVKAITPTVTLAETSYTYDGTGKVPGVTVKDGNTTLTKDTDYTVSYSKNVDVGTADVVVTLKGNYSGSKTEHFTITKRTLTVTAENKQRKYGEENPSLTYTYSGNVNGQTPGFTGNLTTTANNGSNAGEYDITQGTLEMKDSSNFSTSNYNFSFTKGTLKILKADGRLQLSQEGNLNLVLNCNKNIEFAASGEVTATSSKENIATVEVINGNIKITGISVGEARVTITSGATNNYEQATKTIDVTVVPVAIDSIEIKKLPKTSYIEGQNLDITNGKIRVVYNNKTEEEIDITSSMVTGYNKNQIGEQTLTVTYQGLETQYTVVVRAKEVTSIEMKNNPTKETFIQNYEPLDITGGKIKVNYDNGTTEEIDITEEMISGYDNTAVGRNTITVTYEGKNCTFDVEIVEKSVTRIEIQELPSVVEYVQDYGILDVTGGRIKAYFDDETESEINMTKEMVTGFNNKQVGEQTLTVTFGGKTATYEVEVINKVITKIEMKELPAKTEYIQNYEELNISGAKLKVTYNDSYTDEINVLEEMVSGYNNTKVGPKTITVKYAGKETTFEVAVVEHSVTKVELYKTPNKVEYKIGDRIDLTGAKVKVFYNDETYEIIDVNEDMLETEPGFKVSGKKLIKLAVLGQELTFEVDVIEEKTNNGENNNNGNNNSENNSNKDNTTAKGEIPNTGIPTGVIVTGSIVLAVSGGFAVMKMFKHKEIK